MTPYLVTPPDELPVELAHLKSDPILSVVANDDDAGIMRIQEGCVAEIDGYGGTLGRCIMPQTWAVDVHGPGPHLLPFPDASNIVAETDSVEVGTVLTREGLGLCVAVSVDHGVPVTITAEYALPEPRRAAARSLVVLMVKRHYDNAEGAEYEALTRSIDSLKRTLRWVKI